MGAWVAGEVRPSIGAWYIYRSAGSLGALIGGFLADNGAILGELKKLGEKIDGVDARLGGAIDGVDARLSGEI